MYDANKSITFVATSVLEHSFLAELGEGEVVSKLVMRPKIIIDKNIPFIQGVLDDVARVEYQLAAEMTPACVKDVDALIVRTRTQ